MNDRPSTDTIALLEMLEWPGIGVATARRVVASAGETLEDRLRSAVTSRQNFPMPSDDARADASRKVAELLEKCKALNVRIIGIFDDAYPRRLAQISDYPPVLFAKGAIENLNSDAVAVVGTRKASEAGKSIARKIAGLLAARSITLVSGLALGIDTAAHEGALAAGGATFAVLAHGLDFVSPASNRDLADRILESNGLLLSEHSPGTPARPPEFVRRNRIQSGLSRASVIVESGAEGGSVHQARFTVAQRRALFVVLPDDMILAGHRFNTAGAKFLAATEGATSIANAEELGAALDELTPDSRVTRNEATESSGATVNSDAQIDLF